MAKVVKKKISEKMSVPRLVREVALPAVFCQIIVLVYSLTDIFYLGRTGSLDMMTGASPVLPVFNVCLSLAGWTGIGGGAQVARLLEEKKINEIKKVSFFSFYLALAASAVFSIAMFLCLKPITGLLGAGSNTFLYMRQYIFCAIILGGIPMALSNVMYHLVRSIGASKVAGFGIALGGLVNIALDPVFMFVVLPQGSEVLGAGIATLLSNCIVCGYFFYVMSIIRKRLAISLKDGKDLPDKEDIRFILHVGAFPAAGMLVLGGMRWAVFHIPRLLLEGAADGMHDIVWLQACVDLLMAMLLFSVYYIYVQGFKEVTSIADIKRKSWQYVGLFVSIILFPISGMMLARELEQADHEKEANQLVQQARDEALQVSEKEPEEKDLEEKEEEETEDSSKQQEDIQPPPMLAQYAGLWEQNQDLAGWLTIEDTAIDYPVLYTPKEPEYYLHRAFDGSEADSGSLFIGQSCTPDGSNVIIYGHHMRNGTMFGSLPRYEDPEYAKEHPVIHYDTLYEEKEYEVLAAFYTKIYPLDVKDAFRYYWYTDLSRKEVFDQYIKQVKEAALYELEAEAQYGDEILTLSTCSYHTDDGRFVVVARRKQ